MRTPMMPLACILSFLFFDAACRRSIPTAQPITLPEQAWDSTINGKSLNYPLNQKFSLQLDLHADGGFQWDISMTDTSIVCVDSIDCRPYGDIPVVGGLAVETIYFCTMNTGSTVIILVEHRVWEAGVPALDSLAFSVSVSQW
jgi:hypothetical protein